MLPTAFLGLVLPLVGCSSSHVARLTDGSTPAFSSTQQFKVLRTVKGKAQSDYFFGTAMGPQDLHAVAYMDMIAQADLDGKRVILVNVGSEVVRNGLYPLFYVKTISIWGTVVEVNDPPMPATAAPLSQIE